MAVDDRRIMDVNDAINGAEGECYVTIEGTRYNFMSALNVSAQMEVTKTPVPRLGSRTKASKPTGLTGTGSATFHYNTGIFREIVKRFQDEGKAIFFDMQITNEDPSSSVGRQTVILKNCNIDNITVAALAADNDDYLEDNFDFTFDRFEMPEQFTMLNGMVI